MSSLPEIRQFLESTNDELRTALLEYTSAMPMSLITIGKMALSAPGKVMSTVPMMEHADGLLPSPLPRWPLYVIEAYRAGAPQGHAAWQEALPGAVAVEIAMSAADLLDELTDEDPSPIIAQYGPGQALNTGSLMLVMSQQILLKAAMRGGTRYLAALSALQEMLVEAAVGQHLDMLYDRMGPDDVTLEMSADVTSKKAGALIAGAWRIGALLSGADATMVDLLTRLGREIGGIAQLSNDIQDVLPLDINSEEQAEYTLYERKTDLRLRKRTMPIVFALREESEEPNLVQQAFRDPVYAASAGEEALRRAVVDAGGVHFAELVMEVHRQNIMQLVSELDSLNPDAADALAYLVPVGETASHDGTIDLV